MKTPKQKKVEHNQQAAPAPRIGVVTLQINVSAPTRTAAVELARRMIHEAAYSSNYGLKERGSDPFIHTSEYTWRGPLI
jgi:hypothetical protein